MTAPLTVPQGHQQKDGAAERGCQEQEQIAQLPQKPADAVLRPHRHIHRAAKEQVQDGNAAQHSANGRHIPQQQGRAADRQSVEQIHAAPLVHILEGLDGADDQKHQQERDQDGGHPCHQVRLDGSGELLEQIGVAYVFPQLRRVVKIIVIAPDALTQVYHGEAEEGQPQAEDRDQAVPLQLPAVDLPELGKGTALTRGFCQGHSLPPPFH